MCRSAPPHPNNGRSRICPTPIPFNQTGRLRGKRNGTRAVPYGRFGGAAQIPIYRFARMIIIRREVEAVKQEEKKENNWEIKDPKPPVIQSGHMENRRAH